MFDPTVDFTPEQLEIINASYVTVPELREFWGKFPDLTLEAAIGGLKGEQAHAQAGEITAPVPEETQEKSPDVSPAAE